MRAGVRKMRRVEARIVVFILTMGVVFFFFEEEAGVEIGLAVEVLCFSEKRGTTNVHHEVLILFFILNVSSS